MKCKYCKKELKKKRKLKNFCNNSCRAKFQFLNPWQHKIRKIKIKEQIKREDRKNKWSKKKLQNLTKNARIIANKKIRELAKKGKHPFQIIKNRWDKLDNNNPKKIKIIEKLKDRKGNKNPMHKSNHNEKFWNKIKKGKRQFYKLHPEKHPNRIMGKKKFVSKPQLELYLLIKSKYSDAELEYPIQTNQSIRFADIAIPSLKLDIEYDGIFWHINKQLDKIRDKQLTKAGWKTIRINEKNKFDFLLIKE